MSDRFLRLDQALAAARYDAYVATQRSNQLSWTESAEPDSDLPNVAYMLLGGGAKLILPGQAFYYGVVEHLPHYEIAPTEVGAPSAQAQLVEQIKRRGLCRLVFDATIRENEENLRGQLPDVELTFDSSWGP